VNLLMKEFGKFTEQQIREFIGKLPDLFESRSAYHAILQQTPSKLRDKMPEPINWSWAYELSMDDHVAEATIACGLAESLFAMANSNDPQQAVLDDLDTELPADHQPESDNGFAISRSQAHMGFMARAGRY